MRNNFIIKTEDGQCKRLSVDYKGLGKNEVAGASSWLAVDTAEAHADDIPVQLPREEIASSLSDTQLAIAKTSISPHLSDGKPDGFSIVRSGPQDIFARVALAPGDLIRGMDGVHYEGPEDADAFFERLADGGNFSILVQRGDQIQNLHLVVN